MLCSTLLRAALVLVILSTTTAARADDAGLTVGARFGISSTSVAKDMSPYLSSGAMIGGNAGYAFSRAFALVANYEWSAVGTDVRNRRAPAGSSHYVAGGLRFTTAPTNDLGFYVESLIGLRTLSYAFYRDDGFTTDAWELPRGPETERASLRGWEARIALGFTAPITRRVSFDAFLGLGFGKMLHYSDTLNCATFAPGPCGSHEFDSNTFGLYSALRYN